MTLSIALRGEFREMAVVGAYLCACSWLGLDLSGRKEVKGWREEPEARGEAGTRHSLSAAWPRTEAFAAALRHGALSGARDALDL